MVKTFYKIAERVRQMQGNAADFYAIAFSSNRKQRNLVLDIYIVLLFAPMLPFNIFGGLVGNEFYLIVGGRIKSDREYLMQHGLSDFADEYIGGITWQLLVTLTSFTAILILYVRASPILRINNRDVGLFIGLALSSVGGVLGIYGLFFMNDFEFGATDISWFKDNQNSYMQLLPQPLNKLVFVTTGASFLLIMVNALWLLPMMISSLFGRSFPR